MATVSTAVRMDQRTFIHRTTAILFLWLAITVAVSLLGNT